MTEISTYTMMCALISVPAIAVVPEMREALFALFRLSSAMIGTPWP
ncbi:hypothetical protein [Pinisolibacter aquiterrae]|nr:hypothetical protein [Pinisolibacter aquiterrae]MBV5266592.1 hypothetical protein [Pinisolibacter aquiterrae]MCC8234635.1 hypothetical protein [Pinisolibacter aquiterrae]